MTLTGDYRHGDLTVGFAPSNPSKKERLAPARPFLEGRINIGLNMMIASGYTGQTTENFATDYKPGYVGPLAVPENPIAEVVGVRIPWYASVNFTYRFGR